MRSSSLCHGCASVRRIRSDSGSVFYMCGLSKTDPRFAKYPPQPVRVCPGFVVAPPPPSDD